MAGIRLSNVHKRFSRNVVIDDLSLQVSDGEFITLLGPSGCGKSTTLNMIAGLELCSKGQIYFDDWDVTRIAPGKRDVAMVFQSYALYPHLNVFENIAFPLNARKVPAAEINERVKQAAEKLELAGKLERYPRELSGGERQRVALGRAIVRTPKLFLFDEPLSNLDASLKIHMRSQIKELHQELQTTMVYVTHDQAEAMSLSDRIAIMKGGQLQQLASPDQVYNRPANLFVATFIGSPAMNVWQGKVVAGKLEVAGQQFTLPDSLPALKENQSVHIGLRPHHLLASHQQQPQAMAAEVITTQLMGECCFLDLKLAGARTIVRTEADFSARPGQTLYLSYDPAQAHFFDEQGQRLAG